MKSNGGPNDESAVGPEAAAALDRFGRPGPELIDIAYYDWTDRRRDRAVPAKIYFPRSGAGPFPLIIFSHGTGGSRAGYAFLGEHWASHGYASLHVQHLGSDQAVWQRQPDPMKRMKAAAENPENATNRPGDVSFAIDQMELLQAGDSPLAGRLDLTRVGLAGHSFGAHTALAVAGQLLLGPDGQELSLGDSRVKAAIAMSPQAPRRIELAERLYQPIKIPCFHMTGVHDESPLGLTSVADRRVAFDHIRGGRSVPVDICGGGPHGFRGPSPTGPCRAQRAVASPDSGRLYGLLGRLPEQRQGRPAVAHGGRLSQRPGEARRFGEKALLTTSVVSQK